MKEIHKTKLRFPNKLKSLINFTPGGETRDEDLTQIFLRLTEWCSEAAKFTFLPYRHHRRILPASNLHQHLSSAETVASHPHQAGAS